MFGWLVTYGFFFSPPLFGVNVNRIEQIGPKKALSKGPDSGSNTQPSDQQTKVCQSANKPLKALRNFDHIVALT